MVGRELSCTLQMLPLHRNLRFPILSFRTTKWVTDSPQDSQTICRGDDHPSSWKKDVYFCYNLKIYLLYVR